MVLGCTTCHTQGAHNGTPSLILSKYWGEENLSATHFEVFLICRKSIYFNRLLHAFAVHYTNLILAEPKRCGCKFVEVELHQGSFMLRCARLQCGNVF